MTNSAEEPHTTVTEQESEFSFLDLLLVAVESLRILVLLPLVAGLLALGFSFTIPPTFTGATTILPPQQQQGLAATLANQFGPLASSASAVAGIKNPADTYVAMLQSRTVADQLVERFNLRQLYQVRSNEHARTALHSRTRITAGRDGLIAIYVDDEDPKRAAELANAYVDELLTLTQNLAISEASQRRLFFEKQLKQSRDDLTRAELALRSAGINEATLNTVPESALEFVASLKARLTAQEIKLAAMRGGMTESNPEFKQAQNELAAMRAQLVKTEQNDGTKVNGRGTQYIARLRDFKYHETLFALIAKQYEAARLDEAREGALIQVVDKALPPEFKSKPSKVRITLLTTLGVFLLVLFYVFARQALRNAQADATMSAKLARIGRLLRLGQ